MPRRTLLLALLVLVPLASCSGDNDSGRRAAHRHGYTVTASGGSIYVRKNDLRIDADKAETAVIHPDASLSIDGETVETTDAARARLNGYRAAYKALAEDAIALGLDGLDLGLSTMRSVFQGLVDGSADAIGRDADRRAQRISERALGLCNRLSALRDAQQAVVEQLPKFADYAVISVDDVRDCNTGRRDAEDAHRDAPEPPAIPAPPAPPAPPARPSKAKSGLSVNVNVDSGDWSVRGGKIVIPGKGGDAVVSKDGGLEIDHDEVPVPEQGRDALKRYNLNARHVEDEGVGLGLAGADIALGALGSALRGALGGDEDASDQALERKGEAINVRVRKLCAYLREMRAAQQDAVAAIPQFEPYAVVTEKGVRDCGVKREEPRKGPSGKAAETVPSA